ncbi:MAG: hypothetical protein SGJ11_09875 [Phycisphaerae bacterium]|nr:hypothetical protein [Phycisphaerae bacterium]
MTYRLRFSMQHHLALLAVIVLSPGAAQRLSGQSTEPAPTAPTVPVLVRPTGDDVGTIPGTTVAERKRPPLLREGSFLARVAGRIRADEEQHEWLFVPNAIDASGLEREIVLLPNDTLGEATRIAHLSSTPVDFEVTGQLFIYRSRNYLLASLMTPTVTVAPPPPTQPSESGSTVEPPTSDEELVADEMERRLAERIATLPRAPLSAPAVRRDVGSDAADGAKPATVPGAGDPSSSRRVLAGDVRILSRRGQLVRDTATGGWRFVFDGQLADGGEPSMIVLPCLALERIEKAMRESDGAVSIVVSGSTTLFEGSNYLMPTSFRVATGGRGLNP